MTPEIALRADPGQVFTSDEHRRVLATLPDNAHVPSDPRNDFSSLEDMAAHARAQDNLAEGQSIPTSRTVPKIFAWIQQHDPNLQHLDPTTIEEILRDLEAEGHAAVSDGHWAMTKRGFDALNGPNGTEPPPLEGIRLQAAELQDQALREDAEAALAQDDDTPPVRDYTGDQEANR